MEVEGRRYLPVLPLAPETTHTLRLSPLGGLVTQQSLGNGFLAAYNEAAYCGGNTGAPGITTTVALATTYTGCVLSNPIGSGILVAISRVQAGFGVVFPAAASVGLMVGYSATADVVHSTPLTTGRSAKIGTASTPKAKLDSAATLPVAPTLARTFGSCLINTAGSYDVDVGDALVLLPGAFAAIYTSTVSGTAALTATFHWTEVRYV